MNTLAPLIELAPIAATAAILPVSSAIGAGSAATTWQSRAVKFYNHFTIGSTATVGATGVAGLIYGCVFPQIQVEVTGFGIGIAGFFVAAACINSSVNNYRNMPDKAFEDNVNRLTVINAKLTADVNALTQQISELHNFNQAAQEELAKLNVDLTSKTSEIEKVAEQLKTTTEALSKLQDLQIKYQATTTQVTSDIKEISALNPLLNNQISKINAITKEEEKTNDSITIDIQDLDKEDNKMDVFLKNSDAFHAEFAQISSMLQDLVPKIKEMQAKENELVEKVNKLASENEQFKQKLNSNNIDFQQDQQVHSMLRSAIEKIKEQQNEIEKLNAANHH